MKRLSLILLIVLFLALFIVAVPLYAGPRRRASVPPLFPACSVVTGAPGVTFTRDEGRTLAAVATPLQGTAYTYGMAALDTPHTLLSFYTSSAARTLSISKDDGCSWTPVASVESVDFPPRITPAPGGRAYVWSDNRPYMARYDERGLQTLKLPGLKPPGAVLGVGVDRANGERVRVGTDDGGVWESTNGGTSWDPLGRLDLPGLMMVYRFAFDPADLDHLVAGTMTKGAWVSRDGGRTWTQSTIGDNFNAFNLVISPVDGRTVWAMALDLKVSDVPPVEGRHIYHSADGGLTYESVLDQSNDVILVNGPLLVPHPVDANVLYFVFGMAYDNYGTDLFRYDLAARRLTMKHNDYHGIDEIAFSRTDPTVMYLGLEHVVLH